MSSVVQRIKSADIDALYAVTNVPDAVLLTRQSQELGFEPPFILGNGAGYSSPDFVEAVGELADGLIVSDAVPLNMSDELLSANLSPSYSEFIAAYTAKVHREPHPGHAGVRGRYCFVSRGAFKGRFSRPRRSEGHN